MTASSKKTNIVVPGDFELGVRFFRFVQKNVLSGRHAFNAAIVGGSFNLGVLDGDDVAPGSHPTLCILDGMKAKVPSSFPKFVNFYEDPKAAGIHEPGDDPHEMPFYDAEKKRRTAQD